MAYKVFISSVQREFAEERRAIAAAIRKDRVLKLFFEPFLFEETVACNRSAQKVYLDEVRGCDVYLGIFGDSYGNADSEGVSPTEREYDAATEGWTVEKLLYVHDSKPRNEVIAKAMSWTSYVEKSGSGTGDIVQKCRDWGLADPSYQPDAVDFKTIIWRRGYGEVTQKGPEKRGSRKRGAQKNEGLENKRPRKCKGPENIGDQKDRDSVRRGLLDIVRVFSDGRDLSMSMIARGLGSESASGYLKRAVASMCEDGVLERTKPAKARNRFQTYRLTTKGRTLSQVNRPK